MISAHIRESQIHDWAVELVKTPDMEWSSSGDALVIRKLGRIYVYRLEIAMSEEDVIKSCLDHKHCSNCGASTDAEEGNRCGFCTKLN